MKEKLANEHQMDVDLIGTATHLGPWAVCTSPSRLVMLASQIQQKLITKGINRPRFFVGVEKEYAEYTFGCKTEFPCEVIAVIDKFDVGRGEESFKENPKKILIVKNLETKEYDYLEYDTYCSHHTSFGFKFVPVIENQKLMRPGEVLQRGVRLNRSPGVMPEGDYIYSTRTKTTFQSHHAVTEDGFLVSDEWCKENQTTGFGEVTIIIPKGKYPINTYGNDKRYRPLPLPGELIRKDGLLMALREYDDMLGAVEMTPSAMQEYDYYFDEKYFIEAGVEDARVVDIDLWMSDGDKLDLMPEFTGREYGEDDAITRLWKAKLRYMESIVKVYRQLRRAAGQGKEPPFSKKLHRLVTDAIVFTSAPEGKRRFRMKKQSIPTLYVKISFMYDITPTIGYKLSTDYGMKGVICAKKPRAEMPRYSDGTTADLIVDGFSIANRMNPSMFIEQYCNYIAEQRVEKPIRAMLAESKSKETYLECYELLRRYYRAATPVYLDKIDEQNWGYERIKQHVDAVAADAIFAFMPPYTPGLGAEQCRRLRAAFPEPVEHVTWINDLGDKVTSTKPTMIGEIKVIVLEKTGHDWGAVDIAKRQVHGVPTKPSGRERYNLPFRKIPFRLFGESEIRNYVGIVGGKWAADMLDRANNPKAQEYMWSKIISAENPTDLDKSIDRDKIPLGNSMALNYLNNTLYCSGVKMAYMDVDNITLAEEEKIRAGIRSKPGYKDDFSDVAESDGSGYSEDPELEDEFEIPEEDTDATEEDE